MKGRYLVCNYKIQFGLVMNAKGEGIAYIAGARWPFWNLAC